MAARKLNLVLSDAIAPSLFTMLNLLAVLLFGNFFFKICLILFALQEDD